MSCFKLTTDKAVKRLRWLMLGTILFDKFNTLLGQPDTYWQHPETVREGNQFFRFFLSHGWPVYILFSLAYLLVFFFLVSILPRRLALVTILSFILSHYFGASTWLSYRWHFGVAGPIVYGIILAVVLVLLVFPASGITSSEKLLTKEPDA